MQMTPFDYYTIRNYVAADIRCGMVEPTPEAIAASVRTGARVAPSVAAEFAERFFDDLKRHLDRS
jgi:hypothetical protein